MSETDNAHLGGAGAGVIDGHVQPGGAGAGVLEGQHGVGHRQPPGQHVQPPGQHQQPPEGQAPPEQPPEDRFHQSRPQGVGRV